MKIEQINSWAADLAYYKLGCPHREGDGRATGFEVEQFDPGYACPTCGCYLGSDGYWYVDRDEAPAGGKE